MIRKRYARRSKKRVLRFKKARKGARGKRTGSALVGRPFKRRRMGSVPRPLRFTGSINSMVPKTKFVTMIYQCQTENFKDGVLGVLTSGVVYPCNPVIYANSCYDPNTAVTGLYNQSASLHNYMKYLYNRYEVFSSSATFIFRQADLAGPDMDIGVGVRLDDNNSFTSTVQGFHAYRNDPRCRTNVLKCDYNRGGIATIKHHWSRKQLNDNQKANNEAITNATPVTNYYYMPFIGTMNPNNSTAMPHIYVHVVLKMLVRWTDPKDIIGGTLNMEQS